MQFANRGFNGEGKKSIYLSLHSARVVACKPD